MRCPPSHTVDNHLRGRHAGNLSVTACEHAIQKMARDHTTADTVLRRERSYCKLLPINTQNDLAS